MSYPMAPPPPGPAEPPKKKSNTGKILLIVAIVLVVLCGGAAVGGYFLLNKAVDVAYSEGNCIDRLSSSDGSVPVAVPCSDAKAKAKILKAVDNKGVADADTVCGDVPGYSNCAVLSLRAGGTKLLCLGPK